MYQFYDLFDIDFMNWAKIFMHDYKFIFNMMNYFFEIIFSFFTINIDAVDVKQTLMYYKSSNHFLSIVVYMNAEFVFIFAEIKEIFNEKDIVYVIAFNQSHKSIEMIKKINRTLRTIMNKMKEFDENMINLLKKIESICNERHIEYFKYTSLKILHEIDHTSIVVRSIRALTISKKMILSSTKKMLFFVWNHMIKKKKIKRNVVIRITKTKQRMKKRYDRNVTLRKFVSKQFVFLKNINFIYDKNVFRWRDLFVISEYVEEYESNYKLKRLNEINVFNVFHDDHLKLFNIREKYLRSHNEKKFITMKNFRHQRKKILKKQSTLKKHKTVFQIFKFYIFRFSKQNAKK